MTDQEHALAVRKAAEALSDATREARNSGLKVEFGEDLLEALGASKYDRGHTHRHISIRRDL